ncbi:MAG: phosphate signaling complex protein PhoU [Isosphaeraceae bacterium]|nr:phosphate signaling complex protein PhoU [Isosphaeraceae bacterium]
MNLFVRDMERLTEAVLKLAGLVEEMIQAAIRSLCDRKPDLAQRVIRGDRIINRLEVRIEEDGLRILALYDPVAGDLRRVAAALKINHELERIADLAVGIARRALALAEDSRVIPIPKDLETMTVLAVAMVRESLDAFVDADADRSRTVIALDDEVDRCHRRVIDALKATMRVRPDRLDAGLHLCSAAGHLERIADHATNIAKAVVYLSEGTLIRHRDEGPSLARRAAATGGDDREPLGAGLPGLGVRPILRFQDFRFLMD